MVEASGMIYAAVALALTIAAYFLFFRKAKPSKGWQLGPVINGKNHSQDVTLEADNSFTFGEPHYLTRAAQSIGPVLSFTYEITGDAKFIEADNNTETAQISAHFQREGDNWSAKMGYEFFRWYALTSHRVPMGPGKFTVTVPLEFAYWKPVMGTATKADFDAAVNNVARVGLCFGGAGHAGHGVKAIGQARFKLLGESIHD